ncbi:MAG: hypothetical protein GWM98_03240, partial [Nitrospinaceae bacterium]|nr:hypothetical protein [Nitrospinaceae bacterium]NIR55793.1 hypothetical protein [Nitrospinaceae bacterium]NIS86245.1 hypothetical protein [Nitrospinaceae bacterium]NIT80914.1 hypothetical protein [Nitrospinaceae bacterium]NIU43212.1 hypothetical protein [Nitrospinaceae bacterium]
MVIFVNLNSFLVTWSNQVQLIVYLEDGISSDQRQALEQLIRQEPDVESTEYVSKQAAWEKFKNTLSGKNKVLEDLEFNPLPGSYNIRFQPSSQRLEKIRRLVNLLKDKPGVESLEFG